MISPLSARTCSSSPAILAIASFIIIKHGSIVPPVLNDFQRQREGAVIPAGRRV